VAPQTSILVVPADAGAIRLRSMVDSHLNSVWRALRRLGVPEEGADDAAQQVFLVAARRLEEIEPGGERPYLLGIATRVAADARRAVRRRREVPMLEVTEPAPVTARAPDELLDEKRARETLAVILDGLSNDLREAFVLFELEELAAPQVALVLGIRVGTVASRVRRARAAIRRAIAQRRRDP
jgi:RNA polymerase sigma-70 factor (ECF subfamily)